MNSGRSPWENKLEDTTAMKNKTETTETTKKAEYDMEAHVRDSLYCRNQRKSAAFLILLGVILLASAVLSLWAGSYETPVGELLKGIFGQASDEKINIVVQMSACPGSARQRRRGRALGSQAAFCRRSSITPWPPRLPWACPRGRALERPLPSLSWGRELPEAALASLFAPLSEAWRWQW